MLRLVTAALLILFIGLKLTGHIQWNWIFVLMPLWVPYALILIGWTLEKIARASMTPQERALEDLKEAAENVARRLRR